MPAYDITTTQRIRMFIAQIGHESAQLLYTRELASGKAYEGRKDLGNINDGDGVKFKGRGLIQITGRANYEKLSASFDVDFISNPQLLEEPEWATRSACWWWKAHGLNEIADTGDIIKATKRINGGLMGIEDRKRLYALCVKNIV